MCFCFSTFQRLTMLSRTILLLSASTLATVIAFFTIKRWRRNKTAIRCEEYNHFQIPGVPATVAGKLVKRDISISLVNDAHNLGIIIQNLYQAIQSSGIKVLGLDCEWVSVDGHPNPVSLLQLSTLDYCYLIQIHRIQPMLPECLIDILQDKSILKVGVGIMEDAKKLLHDYKMLVRGCVDLRTFTFRHRPQLKRCITGSLADLSYEILGKEMDKSLDVRCGNWEAVDFSDVQISYAAEDAVSSVQIFVSVALNKLDFNEEDLRSGDNWVRVLSLCQGIIDVKFRQEGGKKNNPRKGNAVAKSKKPNEVKHVSKAYSARRGPLYDNCQLLAPDGQLLCTCDRRKAEWYVHKDIGEVVHDDQPYTVRLKFEPSGRPGSERNYYLTEKENRCVVCGAVDSYIRKNVVPHEYRKYFPRRLKEHSSHDVVLLCFACHQLSSNLDAPMRQHYADLCDAPLPSHTHNRYHENITVVKIRSAARALKFNRGKLPEARKLELEEYIQNYCSIDDVNDEVIEECIKLDSKVTNDGYIPHGYKVVEVVRQSEGGLIEFEKAWRQHFLNTMQPKFLPELWSVDHRTVSAGEHTNRRKYGSEEDDIIQVKSHDNECSSHSNNEFETDL